MIQLIFLINLVMAMFFIMWEVGFYIWEGVWISFLKKTRTPSMHHFNLDVYVHFIMLQLKLRGMQTILAKSEGKII